MSLDLEAVRAKEAPTPIVKARRAKREGLFLRGPFYFGDASKASACHPRGLIVWMLVKHRSDLTKEAEVTVPNHLAEEFGASKKAKARALEALEVAGLVSIRRKTDGAWRVSLKNTPNG